MSFQRKDKSCTCRRLRQDIGIWTMVQNPSRKNQETGVNKDLNASENAFLGVVFPRGSRLLHST